MHPSISRHVVVITSVLLAISCGSSSSDSGPAPVALEAWTLGQDLGNALVFVAYGKPDRAQPRFAAATAAAQKLAGVAPGALPEPGTTQEEGDGKVFDYVGFEALQLRLRIHERQGPAIAAAFELSIRTVTTPAFYIAGEPRTRKIYGGALAEELRSWIAAAGFTTPVLDPLLATLDAGAEPRAVQDEAIKVADKMPAAIRAMKRPAKPN